MTDLHDEDSEHFVLDGIDDPPSTMSHPIPIILPGELLASWRAWVVGKRLDPLDDLLSNSPRLDGLDLFGCVGDSDAEVDCVYRAATSFASCALVADALMRIL